MKKKEHQSSRPVRVTRTRILSGVLILVACICIYKLAVVQIVNGEYYYERADRQYITPSHGRFDRGSIFFTKRDGGRVGAATLKTEYTVAIVPKNIQDPENYYTLLNEIIPLDYDAFMRRATKENDPYEEIVSGISEESIEKIRELELPHIQMIRKNKRFYPAETLASHAIGFMAYQGNDYSGRYGIERFFNDTLQKNDSSGYTNFFAQIFSNVKNSFFESSGQDGDIYLTLEPSVQMTLEQQLQGIQEKWNSELTGGIIIHPKTGKIYAMGVTPNFNSNDFQNVRTVSIFNNPLVESVYEVGSIMKPLIVGMGIDKQVITPETSYLDKGSVVVGPHTIYNFDKKGRGTITMQRVLDESLNTGMVFIAQKIQKSDFREYMQLLGFTEKTGITLPGEITGLTSNLKSNRDIEFANMSFGQGIAVTPLTMARALSVLANQGNLMKPYLVSHIDYGYGSVKKTEPELVHQVFSPETAETVTRMLVHTFDSYQSGKAQIPHYAIAGKTGTAQIASPTGGYYDDRNLHSFFGYFPAYNPEFLVYLYTVHPKGVRFASQTLVDPFREIAKFLINYYELPPDRP